MNTEVLERLLKEKEIINSVKKETQEYFGFLVGNPKYRIVQLILQGKRRPGRQEFLCKNLRQWEGISSAGLFLEQWQTKSNELTSLEDKGREEDQI